LNPDSVATIQALVGVGLGEAIVPGRLVDPDDPLTVAIDLSRVLPVRKLTLAFRIDHERSASVRDFIRAARIACAPETGRGASARDAEVGMHAAV
jgi:DNA-binding transcriptional LysR family regulator